MTLLWLSKSETCQACSYMMSGLLRGFAKFVFCPHVIHMDCFAFIIRNISLQQACSAENTVETITLSTKNA